MEQKLECPYCHTTKKEYKKLPNGFVDYSGYVIDVISEFGMKVVECSCGYRSRRYPTAEEAIRAHNKIVKSITK